MTELADFTGGGGATGVATGSGAAAAGATTSATGAIAAFTSAGSDPFEQHLVIALTFFIVSFPCVGLWLLCGSLLKRWLANDLARRRFNQVMAALLVLSVVPVIREILIPA